MNDREIMDITVNYHVKGSEMVTWQDVTRAELLAILEHVENAIKNGTKVESFSFRGNLHIGKETNQMTIERVVVPTEVETPEKNAVEPKIETPEKKWTEDITVPVPLNEYLKMKKKIMMLKQSVKDAKAEEMKEFSKRRKAEATITQLKDQIKKMLGIEEQKGGDGK